uniref:Zinc finger protein 710 [Bos mutus] n=1 Tax=Lepeophtheirus salmonis TaxID=72036 RepID=A0A0K2TL48_LEPSM
MATTDCVIPISGLSADGTATLCGVMTSPSEILLTPVLAQNENGLFALSTPTTTFLSHLKQSGNNGGPHQRVHDKTVKFVQFVLNGPQKQVPSPVVGHSSSPSPPKGKIRIIPEANIRKSPPPPSPVSSTTSSNRLQSSFIDESCTICGQHYTDRSAFKAHIKLHLKEKLNIRRNKRKLEEEQGKENNNDKIPKASEDSSPIRENTHGGIPEPKSRDVIMAELAACQPVPPDTISELTSQPNPLIFPPTPASSVCSASSPAKPGVPLELLQPENHEVSEESSLNFNTVMNKMDINYDLSNILDEIEQNLEPLHFEKYNSKANVETPPDSDAESNIKEEKHTLLSHPGCDDVNLNQVISPPTKDTEEEDKLDLDKLVNEAISSSSIRSSPPPLSQAVVQSPSSIAKVGALPPKALAVLNQLPTKLLGSSDSTGNRFINVVKIERSGGSDDLSNTIINIQCQNSKNNRIIESYRAIDNGKELKLIPNNNESPPPNPAISPPSIKNCSSECSVCGKTITTKNMARHMEKHTGKKKFQCDICLASFFQKTHLKNHIALHKSGGLDKSDSSPPPFKGMVASPPPPTNLHPPATPVPQPLINNSHQNPSSSNFRCSICLKTFVQKGHLNRHLNSTHGCKDSTSTKESNDLECKICHKKCKNKISLNRHRTKHMVCSHCSSKGQNLFFNSKSALQEHLLKFHPESAVLSIENYTSSSSSSSSSSTSDDENPSLLDKKDTFLDYSPNKIKDEKLPSDFALFNDSSSSGSSSVILGEEEEEEEEPIGSSIADISNSDFFDFNQEIQEFYLTDLF